ncbi:MAG: dihydrolipoamide acetyltransferase family protein [Desulfobacterales bacterium]
MIKEIKIPEISENVTSGKVVEVLVEPGDDLKVDDPVIEFETEKAVVEIPSPFEGRITEVLVQEGEEMKVGDVIAKIDTEKGAAGEENGKEGAEAQAEGDGGKTESKSVAEEKAPAEEEVIKESPESKDEAEAKKEEKAETADSEGAAGEGEEEKARQAEEKRPQAVADKRAQAAASPSVRRFARELGVDIHAVKAAGPGERITEADVKAYVKKELSAESKPGVAEHSLAPAERPALPDFSRWGEVETRELTSVRRLTAGSVAVSWQTVVHVTQFERVDITAAMDFMGRNADKVADQGGKLTITAVLMKICAAALTRFPAFNASIDPENNQLILKKYVHIGLAVDTPRGLLVPVVRNVDRKTILELAVDIVDLARRARNKKIKPDEMEGGTFTISNQGGIGGTDFTPVVFWPQAAILGVSRATTEPQYVDGELRPRTVLPLALSYDHRIADGADAARFVRWIRDSIEHPLTVHLD